MKHITLTISLTLITCLSIFGQKLTLTDLTNLCNKKNWEDVNQVLLSKGWTYYDSEKGNTYKYNTITWSFNKDYYSDKAQAWFYLYTYEGLPNKISYSVFNKESYSIIQNSISSAGFKLLKSEIEDNEVISTYGNATYTLKISTEKRKDDDWRDRSLTAYSITIIKKAGIYDPDNGKKTDYYFGDVVKAEYTLSNGKINGQLKVYHYNGKLKKVGSYTNGVENGQFKEYDDDGNIEVEYTMSNGEMNGSLKVYYPNGKLKKSGNYLKGNEHGNFVEYDDDGNKEVEYVMANGMKNGVLKIYDEGKIDVSTTYKDDLKSGQRIEYYYDDETGDLQLKLIGDYVNDDKSGIWKLFFIEDGKERLIQFGNYNKGILNGAFQDIKGDSLIIGSYKNGELHGEYKVYRDFVKTLFGGVIRTDISKLTLTNEGNYYEGLESGYWKNYDLTGTLRSEGRYSNGQETGEWKYYYTSWSDNKGGSWAYSKQLFLVQNYSNGKLDGKSTRYSYLNEEEYPCSEIDDNKNPLDTCKRYVYQKVLETAFYKNGKLNGPFEIRDSLNEVFAKGSFKDDLKDGEWFHRYSDKDFDDKPYFIYQKGNYTKDKREGKWIQYYTEGKISETFNYKNGELHGEYITWNQNNKYQSKKEFSNGNLIAIWNYDPSGNSITSSFLEIKNHNSIVSCIYSKTIGDTIISQGYKYTTSLENEYHNFFELDFFISTGDEKKIVKGPIVREKNVSTSPTEKPSKTEFLKNPMQYMSKNGADEVSKGWQFDGKYLIIVTSNLLEEGQYYNHYKNGLWTSYYYDQKIKIESSFTQDKRTYEKYLNLNGELFSGVFVHYDDENGIKEERKIKDGLRNGKTIYIDTRTKKTIKKENYKNGELK